MTKNKHMETLDRLKLLDFYISDYKKDPKHCAALDIMGHVTRTDILPRIVWNNENIIIHANYEFLDPLGYQYNEIVGKKWINDDGTSDFISPESLSGSLKDVEQNVLNGVFFSTETINEWISKSGRRVPIKWRRGFNDPKNKLGSAQCEFL